MTPADRAKFVDDLMPHVTLRGWWCDIVQKTWDVKGGTCSACRRNILIGKPQGKLRHRWERIVKIDFLWYAV
jgi:hypothetical protein